jgi:formylglycine-generating enzyme required for sulfatase activity
MVNQYVMRGGSCITSADHIRATYRNYYPPSARWPYTCLRLAHDG